MRVVLDTNVLARAANGSPGLANELVLLCTLFENELVLSPFLVSELSRVLRYDRVRASHGLADNEIDDYIASLLVVAILVFPEPGSPRVVLPDPLDDAIVATAIVGRASVLCTLDRHLLTSDVVEYCRSHEVEVVTDKQLLDRLRGK